VVAVSEAAVAVVPLVAKAALLVVVVAVTGLAVLALSFSIGLKDTNHEIRMD
jgi:hypothetical protein